MELAIRILIHKTRWRLCSPCMSTADWFLCEQFGWMDRQKHSRMWFHSFVVGGKFELVFLLVHWPSKMMNPYEYHWGIYSFALLYIDVKLLELKKVFWNKNSIRQTTRFAPKVNDFVCRLPKIHRTDYLFCSTHETRRPWRRFHHSLPRTRRKSGRKSLVRVTLLWTFAARATVFACEKMEL